MATPKYRADWKDVVTRAKAAEGRWILGINAAPIRVLETVNRRASNRWLNDPDGRLYGKAGETAVVDGEQIADIYVRWEWFNPEQAPKILVGPEDQRTLRVSRDMKVAVNAYVKEHSGATQTGLINEILKKYVRYGTRLKPAPPMNEQLRATVPEDLWTKALLRAEQDRMPLVEIVRFELANKVTPKRKRRRR
jgi:hypothetical protein